MRRMTDMKVTLANSFGDGTIAIRGYRVYEQVANKYERNQTTIEIECYVIGHTLEKYEYLLRDAKFTL